MPMCFLGCNFSPKLLYGYFTCFNIIPKLFYAALLPFFHWLMIVDDNSMEGRKILGTHLNRNQSIFYVEVPGGTILSHVVEENETFPFQFGREVRTWKWSWFLSLNWDGWIVIPPNYTKCWHFPPVFVVKSNCTCVALFLCFCIISLSAKLNFSTKNLSPS